LDIGSIISDKDGNPAENAEFEFEGNKYKTDEMGAISEVEPVEMEDEAPAADEKDAKITELETKIADLEAKIAEAEAVKMANEEAEVKLKSDFDTLKLSVDGKDAEIVKLQGEIAEFKKIPDVPKEDDRKITPLEKYRMKKEALIAALQALPDGVEVCVFDWRKELHNDPGDGSGCKAGIYPDFQIEMAGEDFKAEGSPDFALLGFDNDDYDDDGCLLV